MTAPIYGSPDDLDRFQDAANAIGISVMQAMQAEDHLQAMISNISEPLGDVVSWLMDGLGTIISDIQEFVTTGDTTNLRAAAEFVQSRISGMMDGVVDFVTGLLSAIQGNYTGDDPNLILISNFMSGQWEFLGDAIRSALAHLLSWILGGSPEDWDTLEEIQAALIPALIKLPLRVIVNLIGTIPVIGDDIAAAFAGYLQDTNTSAVQAKDTADATALGVVRGWTGGSTTGVDLDVYNTLSSVKDAIGNTWHIQAFTSTTAAFNAFVGCAELKLICVSSGGPAGDATSTGLGGDPGVGGKHKVITVDPTGLTGLDITVGAAGVDSVVRVANASPHTGSELLRVGYGSKGGIAVGPEGYAPSESHAGAGGKGGDGYNNNTSPVRTNTDGAQGEGSADAAGGAGGLKGSTSVGGSSSGKPGGAGVSISPGALVKCGGSGGGGGGGGGFQLGQGYDGGPGADGGFPGGGPGGPGGRGVAVAVSGSSGAKGIAAPGCVWAMWKG